MEILARRCAGRPCGVVAGRVGMGRARRPHFGRRRVDQWLTLDAHSPLWVEQQSVQPCAVHVFETIRSGREAGLAGRNPGGTKEQQAEWVKLKPKVWLAVN